MSNLITLTCPSCGGRLEVTNEAERYVCAHCGNAHVIDPGERVDSLMNEVEILKYDEQIRKIKAEIERIEEQQRQAWQICDMAEEQIAQYRSKKMSGLVISGVGALFIFMGLASGTVVFLVVAGALLVIGLLDIAANDSEARSTQESAMQQVETSRHAIKQKQSQLAHYQTERQAIRFQVAERATINQLPTASN